MKLSDIKGERVFDVAANLIEPVQAVSHSKSAHKLSSVLRANKGAINSAAVLKVLPSVIKENKHQFIKILSTIEGVSAEKYAEDLNLAKLISDVTELLLDDAFLGFLDSQKQTKTEE